MGDDDYGVAPLGHQNGGDSPLLTDRERQIVLALNDKMRERLAKAGPGSQRLEFPAPVVNVTNTVEVPEVHVVNQPGEVRIDAPVVNCVVDAAAIAEAMAPILDKMLLAMSRTFHEVAHIMAERPVPVVRVRVPEPPARAKRKVRIAHSDGSESVIIEE